MKIRVDGFAVEEDVACLLTVHIVSQHTQETRFSTSYSVKT
jgi:hypothetical protein